MGGRKSHSIKRVIGSTSTLRIDRNRLLDSIRQERPRAIVKATIDIVKSSESAVGSLANVSTFYSILSSFKNKPIPEDIKKQISSKWAETKKERKIELAPEVEKLLVNSAVEVLKRRGKNV